MLEPPAQDQPFRLLDLPAEVRNRIYAHYIAVSAENGTENKYNLANFKTPLIAQVSRQLRTEALPVFFAEASFYVTLPCNLIDFCRVRKGLIPRTIATPYPRNLQMSLRIAGTMGVKRCVKDFVRTYRSSAVFRDVTFNLCDADYVEEKDRAEIPIENIICAVNIGFRDKKVQVNVQEGIDCPQEVEIETRGFAFEREDVFSSIELARGVAQKLGERENFVGFTHRDLEEVARVFRKRLPGPHGC